MSKRTTLTTIMAVLVLAAVFAVSTVSTALGTPPAQGDATQQQQTVDAIIADRFTQTAVVDQSVGATQTADAATVMGPTLTAEFNATIDAAFNLALTATAGPQATANAQTAEASRDQVITWESGLIESTTQQINSALTARQGDLSTLASSGSETFKALLSLSSGDDSFTDRQAAAVVLLTEAANQNTAVDEFFMYNAAGDVVAASVEDRLGSSVAQQSFFADSFADARVNAITHDAATGAPVLLVTQPVLDDSGMMVGVLAAAVNFAPLNAILTQIAADSGQPVALYAVSTSESRLVLPADFAGMAGYPVLTSEGITLGVSGQSGSGLYMNYEDPAQTVVGVIRYVPSLGVVLMAEIAQADASTVAMTLPTSTPQPTTTPTPLPATATPRPDVFPTDTVAEVAIAETVFEHGRMFWIRHTRQIWVMVDDPDPTYPGGDWFCYNDTYEEGEPEIDESLVPPDGMYQPRRGFGLLWRGNEYLFENLGWAVTPEFELTSVYTYIAGGYVDANGQYIPGAGEHRLLTLYNESISFFEREVRGDCLGGTWRQTGQ